MPRSTGADADRVARKRVVKLTLIAAVGMVVLIARAFQLQVLEHRAIAQQSIDRSVRRVLITPARGSIVARSGIVLARDREAYEVLVVPRSFVGAGSTRLPALAAALGLSPSEQTRLRAKLEQQRGARATQLLRIRRGLTSKEIEPIRSDPSLRYVVVVQPRPAREYPMGDAVFHAVGHMGEAGPDRIAHTADRPGLLTGRSGAEGFRNDDLRGIEGVTWTPVTRHVRGVEASKHAVEPTAGNQIVLTVDSGIQRGLYDAFERQGQQLGAAVVMEVTSGRILALVSRPSPNPNVFTKTLTPDRWARILDDPGQPMLNRVVAVAHTPGSTFKPFTALAALSAGVPPDRRWSCTGEFDLGQLRFRCTSEHGSVSLESALKQRCHIPFFALASEMGADPIARIASSFGFGEPTGVDLDDEAPGRPPERGSSEAERAQALSASIGQGKLAVTPMQLVVAYAAIANGGAVLRPQLLERVVGQGGTIVRGYEIREQRKVSPSAAHLRVVRAALVAGRIGPGGWVTRTPPGGCVTVALTRGVGEEVGAGPQGNGWAAGYAPADHPVVAFVVLTERTRDATVAETIAVDLLAETLVPRWCGADADPTATGICETEGARP